MNQDNQITFNNSINKNFQNNQQPNYIKKQQQSNSSLSSSIKATYRPKKNKNKQFLNTQQSIHNIKNFQTERFNQQQTQLQYLSELNIKCIIFFIINKLAIILLQEIYLFHQFFRYFTLSNFQLLDFIFVILGNSIDFWMNKNIYAKKLAGLRWWIELNQNSYHQNNKTLSNQEEWIFESVQTHVNINKYNYGIFWFTNIIISVFWFLNLIVNLFLTNVTFWVSLCIFCLGLNLINILCFYKCHGNHQKKAMQFMESIGLKSATNLLNRNQQMFDQSIQDSHIQRQKQVNQPQFSIE